MSDDMWSYLADFADDIVKQERDRIRVVLEEPKVVFSNQRQDGSEWWAYCGLPFPPGPVPTAEASLDFPDAPTYIVYAQPVVVEAERGEILVRQYQMDPSPTGTPRNWDEGITIPSLERHEEATSNRSANDRGSCGSGRWCASSIQPG